MVSANVKRQNLCGFACIPNLFFDFFLKLYIYDFASSENLHPHIITK